MATMPVPHVTEHGAARHTPYTHPTGAAVVVVDAMGLVNGAEVIVVVAGVTAAAVAAAVVTVVSAARVRGIGVCAVTAGIDVAASAAVVPTEGVPAPALGV